MSKQPPRHQMQKTWHAKLSRYVRPLIILGVIAAIIVFAIAIVTQTVSLGRDLDRDINGYLQRAGSATTANNLATMIDGALAGLDKWDMHEGSWALIYHNPATQMEYARIQLEELRDRANVIEATEARGSVGYAMSLSEIKQNLGKIEIDPWSYHTLRHAIWIYPDVIMLCIFLPFFVMMIIFMIHMRRL